jgi:hypothetical protein
MNARVKRRQSRHPVVEGLESRNLLSAGGSSAFAAEVRSLAGSFILSISGTIQGTVTSITRVSATTEVVTYTAHGKANIIGDGSGSGRHTITSQLLKNKSTQDTYTNGSATVQGTTDRVAIHYAGTGQTKPNGSFTATLKGTAASIAGEHAGLSGSFVAQLSGSSRTGPFTISFTIYV